MEYPDINWNQVYLEIGANLILGLFIAILFRFFIVTKTERKTERIELHVNIGVMGFVNAFDDMFKSFYQSFEHHMGNICELNIEEWLPDPYLGWVEIDGGHENKMKPEKEYFSALNEIKRFNQLNDDLFNNDKERLRNYQKRLFDYLEKNEKYIDPGLKWNITQYVNSTVFYVEWFTKNWNYPRELFARLGHAKEIIRLLKEEQSFSDKFTRFMKREKFEDIPEIGNFVKKWQDYIVSEE